MPLFFNLIAKLIPLYLYIGLGYIAGKKLQDSKDAVATMMLYMISPLVIFNGILNTRLDGMILSLPVLVFILACTMCIIFYRLSRKIWTDTSKNIMAFSAGSGGTGYFGIPLAMLIFNPQTEGIYIMSLLGISLYENSLGYYVSARGQYSTKACIEKLIRLPAIYAFAFGIVLNLISFPLPTVFHDFMGHIKGVYVVFGMMIIGIGISGLTSLKLDFKFVGMTFFAKFIVWPLLILLFIELDTRYFGFYDIHVYKALTLLAIVPLAFNTVVMASLMKSNPERAAATVLLSTIFALFYVPIMAILFIGI